MPTVDTRLRIFTLDIKVATFQSKFNLVKFWLEICLQKFSNLFLSGASSIDKNLLRIGSESSDTNFHSTFKELIMIKAISVEAVSDYTILVSLEDGRTIKMDMSYLKSLSGPVIDPLKDLKVFKNVFVRNGIVTWQTGYDIDPYHLVETGNVVRNEAIGL